MCFYKPLKAQIPVADSIPNADFEKWVDVPHTFGGQDPEHWTSSNGASAGSNRKGVAKSTDAYSGQYALEITPLTSGNASEFRTAAVVLGKAQWNGSDFSIDYEHSGVPYTSNIPYITGYYKLSIDSSFKDTVYVRATTQVGNWESGDGGFKFTPTLSYQPFTMKVYSGHFGKIDTLQLGFFYKSNNTSMSPKGKLLIDQLKGTFDDRVGIQKISLDNYSIFPIPCTSILTIETNHAKDFELELMELNGRVLYKKTEINRSELDVAGLKPGMYLVRVTDSFGSCIKKVMKQ